MASNKPSATSKETLEQLGRIAYAQSCLDYTMRTNQTNESRMAKLLTACISALAASGLLMESISSHAGRPDFTFTTWLVFFMVLSSSVLLIIAIFVLIRGITPKIENAESVLLNDYIAARPVGSYVDEMMSHCAKDAQESILIENAAMARVVLSRQMACVCSSKFFYCGGCLLVVSYLIRSIALLSMA